jgi:hypothetical protein
MNAVKLLNLYVERTDAVDKPATGRKFLIMKSTDRPLLILKAAGNDVEELQSSLRELANASYESLLTLSEEKDLHVAQPVIDALNKLSELVDFPAKFSGKEDPIPADAPTLPGQRGVDIPRPGPGGNMPRTPQPPQWNGQKPPIAAAVPGQPAPNPNQAPNPNAAGAAPVLPPANQPPQPPPYAPRPDAAHNDDEADESEQIDQLKEMVETLEDIVDELTADDPDEAGPGGGAQGIGMRQSKNKVDTGREMPKLRLAAVSKAIGAITKALESNLALALRKERTKLKIESDDNPDETPSASVKIKIPVSGVDKATAISVPEDGPTYDYDEEAAMLEKPTEKAAAPADDQEEKDEERADDAIDSNDDGDARGDEDDDYRKSKGNKKEKSGSDEEIECPTCDGEGSIRDGNMECPTCDGEGEIEPDELEKQKARAKAMVARRKARRAVVEAKEKADWSAAYVNNLPDEAFAHIEPGGKKDAEGKTTPRSLRHLPYKGPDGKPDAAHTRNALARLNQTQIPDAAKASAHGKLSAAASKLGIGVEKEAIQAPKLPKETPTSNIDPKDLPAYISLSAAIRDAIDGN